MSLSVGIVGLPNVGKSTLFQALTKKPVDIANYPFCTIDPNVGVVQVPDERVQKLASLFKSKKVIPAVVEFVDIAGLVKGASKGEGLGNQFLSHIRETAAIVQVVRCFEDADIIHVEQSVDPVRDIDIVNTELLLKDLETVEKRLGTMEKEVKGGDKASIVNYPVLQDFKVALEKGTSAFLYQKERPEAKDVFRELQLLSAKPVIYLCNTDKKEIPEVLQKKIVELHSSFVILSAREELDIVSLSAQEVVELGLISKLPALIQKAYEILNLITFLTTGVDETRAWTIERGMTAPQAGGVIHSDFEKTFIRAEVIPWDVLLEARGYTQAYEKGQVRTEGKGYIVQDGDVIEIKHG